MKPLIPDNFSDDADWELKCYYQFRLKKLYAIYLNKEAHIFEIIFNTKTLHTMETKYKILDFRWSTSQTNKVYRMFAITANQSGTFIEQLDFTIPDPSEQNATITNTGSNYLFNFTKSNIIGFLNDIASNSKFYYISYNNDSTNILSGYTNDIGEIKNYNKFDVIHNKESPLEFLDKVKLEEINFIPYTKYAYYKLYNQNISKYYYGIIDIELNQVIYNTDEQITKFIPYENFSMLVITPNSAYQICAIFNENQCVNSCPSSIYYNIVDKNICTDSYKCPNYKLIPNNICINICDKNIFYSNESENERHCGLCKDYDFNKIYKMVNYEDCLET